MKNTHIEGATDCRAATSITIEQNQPQCKNKNNDNKMNK